MYINDEWAVLVQIKQSNSNQETTVSSQTLYTLSDEIKTAEEIFIDDAKEILEYEKQVNEAKSKIYTPHCEIGTTSLLSYFQITIRLCINS